MSYSLESDSLIKMCKQFSEPCQLIHRKEPTPKNDSPVRESEIARQCISALGLQQVCWMDTWTQCRMDYSAA